MEDHLSWFDKHIIQRTKSYKDFVREMENTSPEQFYKDGERVFTDKEKKFLQIYNFKNGIKEFPIVSVKEVPVIPIKNVETTNREPERVETGMGENVKSDRGICADESDKQEIIGLILCPNSFTEKCKCGPVEFPVFPLLPMINPAFTFSPIL